jgi:hypothetical protein
MPSSGGSLPGWRADRTPKAEPRLKVIPLKIWIYSNGDEE